MAETRGLKLSCLKSLFPEAQIYTEYAMEFPKSYTMYKLPSPNRPKVSPYLPRCEDAELPEKLKHLKERQAHCEEGLKQLLIQ